MTFLKFTQDRDEKSETYLQSFFRKVEKVNGSWTETETYNEFGGKLIDVGFDQYEYKGDTKENVVLLFDVDGAKYKVQMNMNFTTRAIFNSILNDPKKAAEFVYIRTYLYNGYGSVYVAPVDGARGKEESFQWRWPYDKLPKVKETPLPDGTTHKSDAELNKFFKDWLIYEFKTSGLLPDILNAEKKARAETSAPSKQQAQYPQTPQQSHQAPAPAQAPAPGPAQPPQQPTPPPAGPPPAQAPPPGPPQSPQGGYTQAQLDEPDDLPF